MNKTIFIFSEPIRSGKTTLLMNFAFQNKNVRGILTPDISGLRKLFDIDKREFHDLETPESDLAISIGKFHFSKAGFQKARQIILSSDSNCDWLIIDEVGKLELEQETGLEPSISSIIKKYKTGKSEGKLMLVVRDSLLEKCIDHYGLDDAEVINKRFFNDSIYHNNLHFGNIAGLVMCGGQSTRMGSDKSMINYHGKPQRYFMYDTLKDVFPTAYLSINEMQQSNIKPGYDCITDNTDKSDNGPMTGLLTAMEKLPGKSFFILGCDYPFFKKEYIQFFISQVKDFSQPACFYNPVTKMEEPLLAFYPAASYENLKSEFRNGNRSLRKYLQSVEALKIIPWDISDITSVDTLDEYHDALKKINGFLS